MSLDEAPLVPNVRMFIKGARAPTYMRRSPRGARAGTLLLTTMLLLTIVPTVQAGYEISLSSSPMAQTVDPGGNGTYTITVHNIGDEDAAVSLTTTQGQGCEGYTSTITPPSLTVAAGTSETAELSVTLSSNAEGDCETTVTGTATAAPGGTPGGPETADVTVTTTAGDGSGGALTGVSLSASVTDKQFNGNNPVTWSVTVENTGQTNETIRLTFQDNATCQSSMNPSVDPEEVQLDEGESTVVTVEVNVPDGTEAGDHCFSLEGEVIAPQAPQESASDSIRLNLEVPEMKECTASVSPSSLSVEPGETKSASVTYYNDGNADWTVGFSASGSKNWISPVGGSTRLLPYDGGNGQATINFEISPDDSLPADSTVHYDIFGLDGSSTRCDADFTVMLGQSRDGSVTIQSSRIDNIEPGSTRSAVVTVNNLGNGQETFSLGVTGSPGWTVALTATQVLLEGKHDSSGSSSTDIQLDVTAPSDALATEELTFTVDMASASGESYDSDSITVSVAAVRSMTASMPALEQWGKTGDIAKFPLTFTNTGNVQDSFRLTVCDDPPSTNPSVCDAPPWPARFSDEAGSEVTTVSLGPGASATVYLDVTVQGEDEFEAESFQIRVRNVNDGSVEERFDLTVIVSNHIYKMALALTEPGEIPDLMAFELPPGGNAETWVIITNVGTSNFPENAIIQSSGLQSVVDVRFYFDNGTEVAGEIPMTAGQAVTIRVTVSVKDGVENGAGGILTISASSTRNAAELSSVRMSIDIRTVNEVGFEVDGEVDRTIEYGEIAHIMVNVTNEGNVEETVRLLSSSPMRGWSIEVTEDEMLLSPGETRQVEIVVKPPTNLDQPDTFQFTITAEPASAPVAAQPIDLSVSASPSSGLFGADSNLQTIGLVVLASLILGAMVSSFRARRHA